MVEKVGDGLYLIGMDMFKAKGAPQTGNPLAARPSSDRTRQDDGNRQNN